MLKLNNIKQNVLILAIAALLTGCGGGGSTDSTTTDSTTTSNLKVVNNIQIEAFPTEDSATIEWIPFTDTTILVEYGTSKQYGSEVSVQEEGTITLYNLQPNTEYHYRIVGEDQNGKKIVSQDNTFTTNTSNTSNTPPEAQNVMIVGTPKAGETLTLDYTFIDVDGDTEGDSIIAWSTPTVEVQRGTSKTFTIPVELAGQQLSAWVHPSDGTVVASNGTQAENGYVTIESDPIVVDSTQDPIIVDSSPVEANTPPEAQNVMIVGTPKAGETLTLDYTFIDVDGDTEGDSIIAWSTPTVEVQRGTSKTFTIPVELAGQQLSAWVHPSDGTVVASNGTQAENGYVTIEAATTSTTAPDTTTSTTPTPEPVLNKSAYEEVVDIPTYDPSNSTHVLITESNGKWNNTVLNDPNKKHFYIEPGTYHSQLTLTQSGTANDRRTISLYNGNDTHPASLNVSEVADIRVKFKGGSYWTLDRLSNINDSNLISFQIYNGASHNIINRIHLKNYYYGVLIDNESNFNTVQNSYIDHMSHLGRLNDKVGLAINTQGDNNRVEGTKFINNDIRNAGDGIQLVRDNNALNVNYPGTIIDSNRIWADGEIRTNGDYATNGYNINGEYQIAENAMDFKAGSDDVNKPIVITNNMMWGYRTGDTTAGGSFTAKYGPAFVVHYNVSNVIFENNAIFDSDVAFTMSGLMTGLPYSGENWSIRNNIFADIHLVNPKQDATFALYFYNARAIEIENNVFANIPNTFGGRFLSFNDSTIQSTFRNNVVIDSQATTTEYNTIVDNNYFYNSKHSLGGENHTYTAAEDANMQEYTFTYKRFTGTPEVKSVQSNVQTTDTSPHSGLL